MANINQVLIVVQGSKENGEEFSSRLNVIIARMASEIKIDSGSITPSFTTANDGRQTANIVYKKEVDVKIK